MHHVLGTFLPLGLFMLIPIWIPLVGLLFGTVLDWLRPPRPSRVRVTVERERSQPRPERSER